MTDCTHPTDAEILEQQAALEYVPSIRVAMEQGAQAIRDRDTLKAAIVQIASLRLDMAELITKHSDFYRGVEQGTENARQLARAALAACVPPQETEK